MKSTTPIPAFAINLKKRVDRKAHIVNEFKGKKEFDLKIVEAFEHSNGALGLWNSIIYIIKNLTREEDHYILICEDDHEFTKEYAKEYLLKNITEADKNEAHILFGGISYFSSAMPVGDNLFWIQMTMGTQFMIVFKRFFPLLISADLQNNTDGYAADYVITNLSNNKLVIHPFISVQKEFGYSDVTPGNERDGFVSFHFERGNETFSLFRKMWLDFKSTEKKRKLLGTDLNFNDLIVPVFIINLPERKDRLYHIQSQFENKPEFDVTIVEACKHEVGAVGLWLSIRKIIETSVKNDYDVIIICEDDHEFTKDYSKEYLLKNIIEAFQEGADYVNGGPSAIGHALPLTQNRYWVSACLATQFIILYKKFFNQILEERFDEDVIADRLLSEMSANKMIIHPAISIQRNFGYSDVTPLHNDIPDTFDKMFNGTLERLEKLRTAFVNYNVEESL